VYKHAHERTGVRVALYAVKRAELTIRSCPAPQGVGSVWLKGRVDCAQARREGDTTEGVLGRSSILSLRREDSLSPTGEDGGTILAIG